MPPAGFEPATLVSDRPQTLALDRSAIGIGRIRTHIPSSQVAAELRRRAQDHQDRPVFLCFDESVNNTRGSQTVLHETLCSSIGCKAKSIGRKSTLRSGP